MGWTSCTSWNKKADVINELRRDLDSKYIRLDDKSTTSGYWAAIENKETRQRYIFFALIEKKGRDFYMKDMDESAGPMYYDCPLHFFDMVPCPTEREWAAEWREKVRAFHSNKKVLKEKAKMVAQTLTEGTKFTLYGDAFIAQFQNEKGEWIVLKEGNGQLYRLKKKQLKELVLT